MVLASHFLSSLLLSLPLRLAVCVVCIPPLLFSAEGDDSCWLLHYYSIILIIIPTNVLIYSVWFFDTSVVIPSSRVRIPA